MSTSNMANAEPLPTETTPSITIRLTGHLIDSLTLTKVFDYILSKGAAYQVHDIHIGKAKPEISTAMLTLFADSEAECLTLLEALQPYGAERIVFDSFNLAPCTEAGKKPAGAFDYPCQDGFIKGPKGWINLDNSQSTLVVVYNPQSDQAKLIPTSALQPGDLVVTNQPQPGLKLM